MSARTDFAVLGVQDLTQRMGVAPFSAPAEFIGTVDATRDASRATARCLEQLQGGQRSSTALIVPMPDPNPVPAHDWALYLIGVLALLVISLTL